jgi:hypothetical protein
MIKRPAAFRDSVPYAAGATEMAMQIDICAVLAAIALSSAATAASERDRGDCSGNDPALTIGGCAPVIEDASESDSNRAFALCIALAYIASGDNDRAIPTNLTWCCGYLARARSGQQTGATE